jgi:hypothetical protein
MKHFNLRLDAKSQNDKLSKTPIEKKKKCHSSFSDREIFSKMQKRNGMNKKKK